jgi:aminopeptidase-like protein
MRDFIEKTWSLNRVTVGADTLVTARIIKDCVGGELHEFESGSECLTWVVPDQWEVVEGVITGPRGDKIADFRDNPLSVCSYSVSFEGDLTLEELKDYLHTNPENPDAIPYHYRWQYEYGPKSKWGFCLPHARMERLIEGNYKVSLKTRFSKGIMPVNDVFIPGETDETVLVCAHTCHPAMVNDGIACVAVSMELIKRLRGRGLKFGLYLDMLGNEEPFCFSTSFRADSLIDKSVRNVFRSGYPSSKEYTYRGVWGNDELFYDGPYFRIPTVCIGREFFRDYHTSFDNIENCNFSHLEESVELLWKILDVMETDQTLRLTYKGPLYLSRFMDESFLKPYSRANIYTDLQAIQILMDGRNSYLDIAEELQIDFHLIKDFGRFLIERKLAEEVR